MPGNRLEIAMNFQGLDKAQAAAVWQPFLDWVVTQDDPTATTPMFAGRGGIGGTPSCWRSMCQA